MKSRTEWQGGEEAGQGGQGNPAGIRQCLGCTMGLYGKQFFTEVLEQRTDKAITHSL